MTERTSKIKMTSKAWAIIIVALIGLNAFQFSFFMFIKPGIDLENTPMDVTSVAGANAANYIGKTVTVDGFLAQGGSNESWLVASMDDAQRNAANKSRLLKITGPIPTDFLKNAGGRIRVKGTINWDSVWGVGELKYEHHVVITYPTTVNIASPIYPNLNWSGPYTSLKFAVLISGGINPHEAQLRFWNDIVGVYSVLVNKYKFDPKNIYVFYKDGHGESNVIPVNGSATHDVIKAGFQALMPKLSLTNLLFIYTTNHGDNSYQLRLWGDNNYVTTDELKDWLSSVMDIHMIIVMQQCDSGQFIKPLGRTNRVIMTATGAAESYSYTSNLDANFDALTFLFLSAINGTTPNGYPVTGIDKDHNGRISMYEAFYHVADWDNKEYPLYDGNEDGIGQHVPWAADWTENGTGNTMYLD